MGNNNSFLDLKGVGDLAEKLVEAQKHDTSISYYKHLTSLQLLQSNREYKAYSTWTFNAKRRPCKSSLA